MPHLTVHELHAAYGIGSVYNTQKLITRWKAAGRITPEEHTRVGAHYTHTVNAFCEVKFCTLIASTRTKDTYAAKIFSKHLRKIYSKIASGCETSI